MLLALPGLALVAAVVVPRFLVSARWTRERPGTAILVWGLLLAMVPLSLAAGAASGFLHLLGREHLMDRWPAFAALCASLVSRPWLAVTAALLAVAAAGIVLGAAAGLVRARRRAGAATRGLTVASVEGSGGFRVLPDERPALFCARAGRDRVVVATLGAVRALSPELLEAGLAHERAHLSGRHHAVLSWADALAGPLRWLPAVRRGLPELARLVEMRADDVACRRVSRFDLAEALLRLSLAGSGSVVPAASLSADGGEAVLRARRLVREPAVSAAVAGGWRVAGVLAAVTAVGSVALVAACWPTAGLPMS